MVKVKKLQNRKHKPPQAEKKFCAYMHRYCTRPRLDGYLYCMSHILEDRSSPFCQCTFSHPINGKRCNNAAPKLGKQESLCPWHAKQKRTMERPNLQRKPEPETITKLMGSLEHYCSNRNHNPAHKPEKDLVVPYTYPEETFDTLTADYLGSDPASCPKTRLNKAYLGHSDSSESDVDLSDDNEPLKHAGVYTYEEVARIYQSKLIKLQKLYLEEMKYLQYVLTERRRDYIRALKNEKKTQGSISSTMPRTTEEEIQQYKAFRAMNRYHRAFGQEAILREKSLRKRLEHYGVEVPPHLRPSNLETCTFMNDNEKCENKSLPLTKFCMDHIMSDPHQVLFKRCPGGGGNCGKVIIPYCEGARCILHSCPETRKSSETKPRCSSPVAGPSGLQNISDPNQEIPDAFQSMDDIASLGLDAVAPGSLFGLNQYGELGDDSTDSCASCAGGRGGAGGSGAGGASAGGGRGSGGEYIYRTTETYPNELLPVAPSDT